VGGQGAARGAGGARLGGPGQGAQPCRQAWGGTSREGRGSQHGGLGAHLAPAARAARCQAPRRGAVPPPPPLAAQLVGQQGEWGVGRQHWHWQQPRRLGRAVVRACRASPPAAGRPGLVVPPPAAAAAGHRRPLARGRQAVRLVQVGSCKHSIHTSASCCTKWGWGGLAPPMAAGGRDAPREERRVVRLAGVQGQGGAAPRWSPPPGTQGSSPYGTGTLVVQALAASWVQHLFWQRGRARLHPRRPRRPSAAVWGQGPALPACQHAPNCCF
jgi:hypothetical protein